MELGKIISVIIKKRGLTQVALAKKIGKSPTALSQIIKGNYYPSPDTLEKISNALDVPKPIFYFLSISEEEIPADKLELYRLLAPAIEDFLLKIFGSEYENILEMPKSLN